MDEGSKGGHADQVCGDRDGGQGACQPGAGVDEVADAFREHLRTAVETMGGATFVARPELHCSGDYSFGQCAIHVIPEVTE